MGSFSYFKPQIIVEKPVELECNNLFTGHALSMPVFFDFLIFLYNTMFVMSRKFYVGTKGEKGLKELELLLMRILSELD
jgi:hypothetical protein